MFAYNKETKSAARKLKGFNKHKTNAFDYLYSVLRSESKIVSTACV